MNIFDPVADHSRDIATVMAEPALAQLHISGAPVVIAAGTPPHVIYASASAARLFGTSTMASLTARLFCTAEPGSQRLKILADGQVLAARLERLRFSLNGIGEILTVQCRTTEAASGTRFFVLAALGVRPALLRGPVPPSAETTLPKAALAEPAGPMPMDQVVPSTADLPPAEAIFARQSVAPPPGVMAASAAMEAASVSGPRLEWEAACKLGRPLRFSWRSDAADRLTEFPEILAQAIGLGHAEILESTWPQLAARLGLDSQGELARALARRATFSAVETLWPLAGSGALVPVVLGATPVALADHAFDFYRGFGLIHPARISAVPEPVVLAEALPKVVPHEDVADIHPAEPDSVVAEPDVPLGTLPDDVALAEPLDGASSMLATPAMPAPSHAPANSNHHLPLANVPEADAQLPLLPSQGMEAEEAGTGEPEPAAVNPEPASASDEDAKIVRLRPLQGHLKLAAQTDKIHDRAATLPPASDPAISALRQVPSVQGLSSSERQAFSEIARSLTAKIKDTAPEILKPVGKATAFEDASIAGLPAMPVAEWPAPHEHTVAGPEQPPVVVVAMHPAAMQEGNLAHLFQRLPLGVLVSRDGAVLFVNPHLLDMLGYADAQAFEAGNGLGRMFRGRSPEALDPALEGGTVPLVALNGDVLMAEARLQAVEWAGIAASLLTVRRAPDHEVHARVQALELDVRQREAEARELHAILDTATDGVAILDDNGLILSLNRSAEALFGYEQNEVAGEAFTVLVAADQIHLAKDYFHGIKTNGVASVLNDGREMLGRARQGGAIPLFMTLGRVGPGANPKFCAILRDLTQWKKVEGELGDAKREAERASQLKSDFLAKISHEIRTPLNAILGFAEVMSEERFGAIGNERYKEYLRDIHASGEHVMSLVNDLLDLSKIEAGKMELEFSSVDANKIVTECVSMMNPQAATDRVIMRQSLAPRLPNIVADERALRQIVLNLLSNAVKFNEAGGQVIVSTALTDAGHAVIRIRDTGVGMSDADVLAALEPFKQLQTSRKQSGTGLGLPLTKALVEANRASFSIKSKKGEGTLVEVAFPPTRVLAE